MVTRRLWYWIVPSVTLGGLAIAAVLTYDSWKGWLPSQLVGKAADQEDAHDHGDEPDGKNRLRISVEGQKNLKLDVRPLKLQPYDLKITLLGSVAHRPGENDRGVTAPFAGVVSEIKAVPGRIVRSGDELFTLRLVSEFLQNSQAELFKATQELQINRDEIARYNTTDGKRLNPGRVIELEYQQRRLEAAEKTLRHDLAARGLHSEQIESAARGQFLTTIKVTAPELNSSVAYEVEDLKVNLGEQVQAGQTLANLANHETLYVEARAFETDAHLLEKAIQKAWPIEAEFLDLDPTSGKPLRRELRVLFSANQIDPASRTFALYLPLANELRALSPTVTTGGNRARADLASLSEILPPSPGTAPMGIAWRFRPGQRVLLHVPVERFEGQLVLPAEAVVREGPEAYVFRANGQTRFDRIPVHILGQDQTHVVIDKGTGEGISEGDFIAHNAAATLNRVLKAQAAGEGGHGHDHDHAH